MTRESTRRFHFIREIASGGFGGVYLTKVVHSDGFSRLAAVKLLHRRWTENEEVARRMRDEARLLGWLRHRNIVDVVDLTSIDGRAAIVMEYLEAVDFKTIATELAARNERLPSKAVLEIMAFVASALDAAYNRPPYPGEKPLRVIHRDIKPSNIMVDETGLVKVLDFGVARADFESRESHTRELQFGSVDYMPPERLFFEPETPASDVYSLGATIFEIVALEKLGKAKGRPERHARFLADRLSFMRGTVPLPPAAASEFQDLLTRCLAFEHSDRPSASEVVAIARQIGRTLPGIALLEWAEDNIPPILHMIQNTERAPNPLVDSVLTEDNKVFFKEPVPESASAPRGADDPPRTIGEAALDEIKPAATVPRSSPTIVPDLMDLPPLDEETDHSAPPPGLRPQQPLETPSAQSASAPPPSAPPPSAPPPGQGPSGQSPTAQSPAAQSPAAQSPGAQSPAAQSPAAQGLSEDATVVMSAEITVDKDAPTRILNNPPPRPPQESSVATPVTVQPTKSFMDDPIVDSPFASTAVVPTDEDDEAPTRLMPKPDTSNTVVGRTGAPRPAPTPTPSFFSRGRGELPSLAPSLDDWSDVPTRIEQNPRPSTEPPEPPPLIASGLPASPSDPPGPAAPPPFAPPLSASPAPPPLGPLPESSLDQEAATVINEPVTPADAGDATEIRSIPSEQLQIRGPQVGELPPPVGVEDEAPVKKKSKLPMVLGVLVFGGLIAACGCGGLYVMRGGIALPGGVPSAGTDPVELSPPAQPVDEPVAEAPAEAPAGPHMSFVSLAPDTKKIKVACTGAAGKGAETAIVVLASADKCQITAYMQDRSRLTAVVTDAKEGEYRCFEGGESRCDR